MRDQRVLRAIADLRAVVYVGHRAGLVGGFLQVLEIIQSDAIEGARYHRQLDLDVLERKSLRRALVLAKGIAADGEDLVAFDDAPGGIFARGEFQPTHLLIPYSAAARGRVFQAPAAGRLSPRFS